MTGDRWLSRPLAELVRSVAVSVAEGQEALDRRSARTQRELEAATAAGELEYAADASWLRFSEVEADLRLAVSMDGEEITDDSGTVRGYRPTVSATPLDPRTRTVGDVDVDLASNVRFRLTPVAPERVDRTDGTERTEL
jgi:hypothetical protein